jgi:hypothetical protein
VNTISGRKPFLKPRSNGSGAMTSGPRDAISHSNGDEGALDEATGIFLNMFG